MKWRVDGRDKTRSVKTKVQAERLRSQLQVAADSGVKFDVESGLPESWVRSEISWWSWSQQYVALKWARWSGHSRRSAVESLTAITPHMVDRRAPSPPDDLSSWLRNQGYQPDCPDHPWLARWSVPLSEVDASLLERVLTAATMRQDGASMSAEVVRRRRTNLGAVLRSAVRRGLLDSNPLDQVEWTAPERNLAVDVSTVPSFSDVIAIVDQVAQLKSDGARYGALYACVGMAGMRPSEAIGLDRADLELPGSGWGLARLRGATTSPGKRYTSAGDVSESKALKQRPTDAIREVPLPAFLVVRLVDHLDRYGCADGKVFLNGGGRPVTTTNYHPVWSRARAQIWPRVTSLQERLSMTCGTPPPQ